MQRIPSAGTAVSSAAAAEIRSRMHRPARALAVLAALPMSMHPRTQTAIIIARLRSKTARILHSIKNLFRLRRLLHRRIPYNPPPKRWRAHSHKPRLLAPASSPTLRAKLLCRPAPDVHRATWQRRRTMQRPRQQKPRPVRRIVPQELRSLSWAARSRRIRSRNRPYIPSQNPIHAAARRCRITAVLLCPARQEKRQAKIHRAVPVSRPAAQESRITAAIHKGQSVQTESAQQRSTFVQPPDAQRGAPNTAAPNAAPNTPASPPGTPRSPAQPVGSAGKGQMQSAHTETTQQRSTFAQTPNMAAAQQSTAEHPSAPISSRSGMAGNPSVPHIGVQSTSAPSGTAGKQPDSHSAPARDTAGNGARPQQSSGPQNTPVPGTAGTQRTSIGGRYTQPVQQTTRVSTNGNTQITQQNHVSAQQSGGTVQPSSGVRMDGRSTNREHPAPTTPVSPAAPSSNREAGTPPRSTTRPDVARPAGQHASQRPIPAQSGSAEKPIPQTGTQASPVSVVSSERQSRKPPAPAPIGSVTAPTPVSQESRGLQRSPAAESSAKRPVPQERKAGTQPEPQKKEQTLYHRPGTAGIAPTAVGINTEAASAVQKPAAEKTVKKPFVPLTGRTPESIPSHLDLHEASQKTTKRPKKEHAGGGIG